ncbi:MAG: hypothetical protein IJH83_05065 [Coriobacteriales bacterium]|nr:hypothetical protein [Coriobacteriales bacterium]
MSAYDVNVDGYRYTRLQEAGFVLLGFVFGLVGVLVDWAIARKRKMMECSAEGIWLGIIGWATAIALGAILGLCGVVSLMFTKGWTIFFLVVAILFICLADMWVYGMKYKMTPQEKATPIMGDDWIKPGEKHLRYDSAITIDAPAGLVWQYVQQCGQSKAGWYSFDWLEQLFTFDIHNHYDIHPEWQGLQPGEFQWFHQAPLSIGEWVTQVSHSDPYGWAAHSDTATDPTYANPGPNQEKALGLWFKRFCWTWNWEIRSIEPTADAPDRCRLRWRCDCTFERYHRTNKYFVVFILGTASIVMGRRFMDVMKALAEGRFKYPDSKR